MASFLKDLLSVGISKFAVISFGLAKAIILARWLGPEGNGIIAALAVYPSLFMSFGSLGISQSATHFIGKGKFLESEIKSSITQIWFFSTIISVIISFALIRYLSDSGENLFWVFLAITPIPFTLFNKYNSGLFLGKNQIKLYNKINWLPAAFILIGVVLFVVIIPMNISGALIALILGPLIMFFILLFKNNFINSFNLNFNWRIIKSLLSLGLIYALALLLINLNYKIDIILLDKISNSYNTGIYSKGVAITEYLWQIPMLLSTIVFARSANAKDAKQYSKKVAHLLRLSIILIGLGSIVLLLIAKPLILIMYGNSFIESSQVLQLLLPGILLLTIFKVLNMDLAGRGKPWVSMKAMVPALIINVILNFILIPDFGADGAALASTISYILAAILFLYFYSIEAETTVKEIFQYSKKDFVPMLSIFQKLFNR